MIFYQTSRSVILRSDMFDHQKYPLLLFRSLQFHMLKRISTVVLRLVSKGCKLVGCGSAVPSLQVSNDDLAKVVDTSDEWISVRTGIHNRRVLTSQFFLRVHACWHLSDLMNSLR